MGHEELFAAVEVAFARTGAATPPWPAPREFGEAPQAEEYSRVSDPGKYLIQAARVEAWAAVLIDTGAAVLERPEPDRVLWRDESPPVPARRVLRLVPARAAAVPIVFWLGAISDVADTCLHIGFGAPAVVLLDSPDCGCDACDSGSDDLLSEIDKYVLSVVTGNAVHVRTPDGHAISWELGWYSASGTDTVRDDIHARIETARAGRSGFPTLVGAPWF